MCLLLRVGLLISDGRLTRTSAEMLVVVRVMMSPFQGVGSHMPVNQVDTQCITFSISGKASFQQAYSVSTVHPPSVLIQFDREHYFM